MSDSGEVPGNSPVTISPTTMEGRGSSSGAGGVDEEEEASDTTMVMTCQGNIADPDLQTKLDCLMNRLKMLSKSGQFSSSCWYC